MDDQVAAVASPCMTALARLCQVMAGETLTWRAWPDLDGLAARFDAVPAAASYAEAVMAIAALLQFTNALGDLVHRRIHGAGGLGGCPFNSESLTPPIRIDREHPETWTVASATRAWARRYDRAIASKHDLIVERAKERLARDLARRLCMRQLARELACSVAVLRRRFASQAGETPACYQTRLRAIAAVRLIRGTTWKMDAVAREVGWKSRKDLYRAIGRIAGMAPASIRALGDTDADALLSRMTVPAGAGRRPRMAQDSCN